MNWLSTNPASRLVEEYDAVRAMTQLLQLEQELLIAGNVEALADMTAKKTKAASRMAELAKIRHTALGSAGYKADETGMQDWLINAEATTYNHWRDMIALATVGKELNRVNGMLINKQLVRIQNVLNVLQHGSVHGSSVYGRDGQTSGKTISRHIVAG